MSFREVFHDAVELGHTYHVCEDDCVRRVSVTKEIGLESLHCARQTLAIAKELCIAPQSVCDRYGRLLVELLVREEPRSLWVSNGLRQIEAGYSFPVNDSPQSYVCAEIEARQNSHEGVYWHDEPEVRKELSVGDAFKPWSLKRTLQHAGDSTETVAVNIPTGHYSIHVENSAKHLKESNLFVARSRIPGAGMGLFVRSDRHIPANKYLCVYASEPTVVDTDNTDYMLEVSFGGQTLKYNSLVYNGVNLGRFVNQGGLEEGLKAFCQEVEQKPSPDMTYVKGFMKESNNVKYVRYGASLHIYSSRDIPSRPRAEELYADYGLLEYWLPYILKSRKSLPADSILVKSVMWCVCAAASRWDQKVLLQRAHGITDGEMAAFRARPNPFPLPQNRRTRRRLV